MTAARYVTSLLWIGDECDFPHVVASTVDGAIDAMGRGSLVVVSEPTLAANIMTTMGYTSAEAQRWVSWAQGGWSDVDIDSLETQS